MDKKIIIFGLVLSLASVASARVIQFTQPNLTRFEQQTEITVTGITTPKVVVFETREDLGPTVALYDKQKQQFIRHQLKRTQQVAQYTPRLNVESTSDLVSGTAAALIDENLDTTATFNASAYDNTVTLNNPQQTQITGFSTVLDTDSPSPKKLSVRAFINDEWVPLLQKVYFQRLVVFPPVTAQQLEITYHSPNLLQLKEIEFRGLEAKNKNTQLIFFAQEGGQYQLLTDPHFGYSAPPRGDYQPLSTDDKTPKFTLPPLAPNPVFNPDFDGDGVNDFEDLCPRQPDPNNADIDNNGRGDVCEDPDQDRHFSAQDNCPFVYNPNQADKDADGLGDECDDHEGRATEQNDFWITMSFIIMVIALIFLVGYSASRPVDKKPKARK